MAFQVIDVSKLPVREVGRHATEPRISVSEAGTFVFNSLVKEKWGFTGGTKQEPNPKKSGEMIDVYVPTGNEVTGLLIRFDPDTRMVAFNGFKDGPLPKGVLKENLLPVRRSKDGSQIFAAGSGICNQLKYDFAKSGNQSFKATWDEKGKFYAITLPEGILIPRPKQERKKKAATATVATSKPNGAVAMNVAPPAEEELLDLA